MVPRVRENLRPFPPARDASAVSKASIPSVTPSNDADDELSVSSSRSMRSGADRGYPGEDRRLTSTKELAGFYAYGWAAEVFVVCGIGSFIPITLEQLARERGVLLSDHTTPCRTGLESGTPPPGGHASPTVVRREDGEQCVIYLLGVEINTASFAMYTFSLSVLIQALLIISMSGAADHGQYRKKLLLIFAFTGSVATMLFLPVVPKVYVLGALCAIVANTCFGASFVLLNSFLPLLVRYHPTTQLQPNTTSEDHALAAEFDEREGAPLLEEPAVPDYMENSSTALLPEPVIETFAGKSTAIPKELELSTKISAYGMGIGYVAAVFLQAFCIFIVIFTGSSLFSLRLVLFIVGAWWFIFTLPAAMWLRPRPGPPLILSDSKSTSQIWLAYFKHSWKSLGRSIMRARHLRDVILFLAAWFLLSDGIATVSGTAVLFAKTSLGMKPAALAMINVIATLSAVVGAFGWRRASTWLGLQPNQTILACMCLFEVIPLYGLLGYVPMIRNWGVLGLQKPWEMYALGAVFGLVIGGLSSYCRSLFGELIPPGSEAAFYALYAITDKGSSVFGPAIVGAITDATGEIRPAFWFLAALLALPFPLMYFVDVKRGRAEGIALAKDLGFGKEMPDEVTSEGNRDSQERSRLMGDGRAEGS